MAGWAETPNGGGSPVAETMTYAFFLGFAGPVFFASTLAGLALTGVDVFLAAFVGIVFIVSFCCLTAVPFLAVVAEVARLTGAVDFDLDTTVLALGLGAGLSEKIPGSLSSYPYISKSRLIKAWSSAF